MRGLVELIPTWVSLCVDSTPVVQVVCELREVPEGLERVQSVGSPFGLTADWAINDNNSRNNSPALKLGC